MYILHKNKGTLGNIHSVVSLSSTGFSFADSTMDRKYFGEKESRKVP